MAQRLDVQLLGASDREAAALPGISSVNTRPHISEGLELAMVGVGSSGDELPSGPSAQVVREEDRAIHAGQKRYAPMPTGTGVVLKAPKKGGPVGGPKGQRVGCSR